MLDAYRPLSGVLRDADAVLDAFRARKDEIGLSNDVIDDIAGYAGGRWNKAFGPGVEKMPTLGTLMSFAAALGVSFVMIEDLAKVRRVAARWERRDKAYVQTSDRVSKRAIARALPFAAHQLASAGGKARWSKVTPEAKAALIARLNEARAAKREAKRKSRAGTREAA